MADVIDQEIESMFGGYADTSTDTASSSVETSETPTNTSTSAAEDASTNNDSATTPAVTSDADNTPAPAETETTSDTSQTFSAEEHFNKQNKAFAEMRIKNKDYEQFIMQLAAAANLNAGNVQEAKNILAERVQQLEAKQKNTDPKVLKELEDSRKRISEMENARLKEHAISDFARLKSLHGLSDSDLNSFADLLISKNKNPFEQEMDVVNEYRLLNFDKLIEQAREQGRQEEIARRTKAQTSSTNPGTQRAASDTTGEPQPIKDEKGLTDFFKSLGL